jgi:hypothetical protein
MSTIVDVDTFLDFLVEVFVEQPREVVELGTFEDLWFVPTNYEAEHRKDSSYERGDDFTTLSVLTRPPA